MNATKRLFLGIAALAAVGIVGCLDSESTSPQQASTLPQSTEALLTYASDGSRPAPVRLQACEVLGGRLGGLDSASAEYAKLEPRVAKICAPVPGFLHHGRAPADTVLCAALRDSLGAWLLANPGDTTSMTFQALSAATRLACLPPPPPPKPCDSLVAGVDSSSPGWDSLKTQWNSCRIEHGIVPPPPANTLRCDTLRTALAAADSNSTERDSLYVLFRGECVNPPAKPAKPAPVPPKADTSTHAPKPAHPAPVPPKADTSTHAPKPLPPAHNPPKDSAKA